MNAWWIFSNVFSLSINMIIWFFSCSLLIWHIALTTLILNINLPCIPEIKTSRDHGVIIFYILLNSFFKKKTLFIFREKGMEGEREGEKHRSVISCLSYTSSQGPDLQPRHVPRPEVKWASFQLADQYSVHWTTPARAIYIAEFYLLILCWGF